MPEVSAMSPEKSLPPDDGSSSESSEDDDDDLVKSLYAKLPEDLGFTLLGLGFNANDFKVLRRLKMDLDTFMTLSESELADLGVKDSSKIKQLIKPNLELHLKNNAISVFSRPKKSLELSLGEIFNVLKGIADETANINRQLLNLNSILSLSPPVNYRLSKTYQSREIFWLACKTLHQHSLATADELQRLEEVMGSTTPSVVPVIGPSIGKKKRKLAPWIKPTLFATTTFIVVVLAVKKFRPRFK